MRFGLMINVSQVDQRDNLRPLNYRGRFMEGISTKGKDKDFFWRAAKLFKEGRTEQAQQIQTSTMVCIEPLLEDQSRGVAITAPDSDEYLFHGARKVEQIGQNACEKLLNGMLTDLPMTGRSGVFLIDLNLNVGNMYEAFAALKGTWNQPVFFVGATDDPNCAEWFNLHKVAPCLKLFDGMLYQTKLGVVKKQDIYMKVII